MVLQLKVAGSALLTVFLGVSVAQAEVIRCEITNRSHRLMPEWIEYEIGLRGTVLEIRDSVGAQIGVDWVRGDIVENTARRLTLSWDVGPMPRLPGWYSNGRVLMSMTRLADGTVHVRGIPTTVRGGEIKSYNGDATCTG